MCENRKLICPVCGKERAQVTTNLYACEGCGFELAYVTSFASQDSLDAWKKTVAVHKKERQEAADKKRKDAERKLVRAFAKDNRFAISGNTLTYLSKNHVLYMISGNGTLTTEAHVKQVSLSERNIAILYQDNTVKVIGSDNGLGQQNTQDWKDIMYVLSTANATYGVTRDRKVVMKGATANASILEWTNIKSLYGDDSFIVGVGYDRSIRTTNNEERHWDDQYYTEKLAISNQTVFLHGNYTKDDKRIYEMRSIGNVEKEKEDVMKWYDCADMAADRSFIYMVNSHGQMMQAGKTIPFLDHGRSEAKKWNNLLTIATNDTGVAAITKSGAILYAGAISGDYKQMRNTWFDKVKPVVLEDIKRYQGNER